MLKIDKETSRVYSNTIETQQKEFDLLIIKKNGPKQFTAMEKYELWKIFKV